MSTIKSIQEFSTFNYGVLFNSGSAVDNFYRLFAHPAVPFVSVFLYLILSKWVMETIRKVFGLEPKGPVVQAITIGHSSFLAVYSGWTFWNSISIVAPYVMNHGFYNSICDVSGDLWFAKGLGFWVTHFYISKYYEFIDTWIVILKGRDPMFLQVYHHAGVVLIMWGMVVTAASSAGLVLICLNSFIHTLMYTYYVLSAFGYNSPLKNYLTMAQIVQFLVGIAIITPSYLCSNPAQRLVVASLQAYAIYLTYLFYQFYQESYNAKKKAKGGAKKSE